MKITFDRKSDGLVVRFAEEKSLGRWFNVVFTLALFAFAQLYLAFDPSISNQSIGARETIGLVISIFPLGYLFVAIRNLFGAYELEISPESLTLRRRVGPFASRRSFKREDVDWLAFSPEVKAYKSHEDSALSVLVRQNVMPIGFAHTITPDEATRVFGELAKGPQWMTSLIRPVGTAPF